MMGNSLRDRGGTAQPLRRGSDPAAHDGDPQQSPRAIGITTPACTPSAGAMPGRCGFYLAATTHRPLGAMASTTRLCPWITRRGTALLAGGQELLEFLLQTADDLGRLGGAIDQDLPDLIDD